MSIVVFSVIAVLVLQYADGVMAGVMAGADPNGESQNQKQEGPQDVTPNMPTGTTSNCVSFLVCGVDEMNGWADGMFLVRIDKDNAGCTLISIPANTRLYAGGADRSIGSLVALESPAFLKEKVHAITGIPVDYYVSVNMEGFVKLVDLAGGVNFEVPQDMAYKDAEQALKIDLKAGYQLLDGEKALQLVRYCGYANATEGRHNTQMEFFKAFAAAVMTPDNVFQAQNLVNTILENVSTDMTATDFLANASLIFTFGNYTLTSHVYPGRYVVENGVEWYVPSVESALTMFESYR